MPAACPGLVEMMNSNIKKMGAMAAVATSMLAVSSYVMARKKDQEETKVSRPLLSVTPGRERPAVLTCPLLRARPLCIL